MRLVNRYPVGERATDEPPTIRTTNPRPKRCGQRGDPTGRTIWRIAMTTVDRAKAAKTLADERARLVYQLTELGADESGDLTGEMDFGDAFADAGAATAERTETIGIVDNLKKQLDDVNAAIAKIDAGTYGLCDRCGKAISADRLEFRPMSVLCIDCKSKT
jgi:RNA polymerase-binding transcription factor